MRSSRPNPWPLLSGSLLALLVACGGPTRPGPEPAPVPATPPNSAITVPIIDAGSGDAASVNTTTVAAADVADDASVANETPPPSAAPEAKPVTGTVTVVVRGLRNDKGRVLIALFSKKRGFPDKVRHATRRAAARIRKRSASVKFRDLPPGPFAIAIHHDEDGDRKMKTGLMGIPKEGYGASRDAKSRFGPPKFRDAVLELAPGEKRRVIVPVHY